MINDGINNVPDKTIAVFIQPQKEDSLLTKDRVLNMVKKSPRKRDWFDPHFYRCLPLVIGNQYGFIISLEFDVALEWNGGLSPQDSIVLTNIQDSEVKYPRIESHFGHGIITINTPYFFRTPPGVNLMTINPPNYYMPNITPMTGVIETDNLRRNFTFNLKIQMPGIRTIIPAGSPLAAFIPVPRYYCDAFDLKFADDIFDESIISEEEEAVDAADKYRENIEPNLKNGVGRHYFLGKDVYNNEFKDHQKP